MNWRDESDLYNAHLFAAKVASLSASRDSKNAVWKCFGSDANCFNNISKTDWREIIDLYNAHLFAATAATAKAVKLFKIQIKQPISVGMWTEELLGMLRHCLIISRHKSSNSHEVENM